VTTQAASGDLVPLAGAHWLACQLRLVNFKLMNLALVVEAVTFIVTVTVKKAAD
jgi:hypothetical protein